MPWREFRDLHRRGAHHRSDSTTETSSSSPERLFAWCSLVSFVVGLAAVGLYVANPDFKDALWRVATRFVCPLSADSPACATPTPTPASYTAPFADGHSDRTGCRQIRPLGRSRR